MRLPKTLIMGGRITVRRVGDGPLWAIGSSYFSPALVEHSKAVPGMRYDNPTRGWQGYPDAVTAVVARLKVKGIRCDGADELPDPNSWRTARTPFLFSTLGLRDYQIEGVRFLIARAREGALLADGMRLGKSLECTVAARAFKAKTLVLCPSHVVGVWGRPKTAPEGPGEIAKWWPDAWRGISIEGDLTGDDKGVVCLETVKPFKSQETMRKLSSKKELTKDEQKALAEANGAQVDFANKLATAQVIVCHYDIIYAWVDVLKAWGMATLICDEGHVLSGWASRRAGAIKDLRETAARCILATGTPVTNLPRNLHNLLEILAPNRFGYFFTGQRPGCFSKVFCNAFQKTVGSGQDSKTVWDYSGRSNIDVPDGKTAIAIEETLKARLKFVMLRRLAKDVDAQLPTKTRQIIDVRIPPRNCISVSQNMLGPGGGELRRCLDLAADGKLKSVVALIEGHIDEGEKVLCFCYRRLFAERIAEDIENSAVPGTMVKFVHGGLSQKERDKRIHALRTHTGPGVLACTIDTTSTGLDLSFASVAVFGELTWEFQDLSQAESRTYKFGVDSKSLIQYVIARGTGDELILRGIINKLDTSERAGVASGDAMKEDLSAKKEGGMARLYAALAEMQKAATASLRMAERLAVERPLTTRAVLNEKRRILERDRLERYRACDSSPGRTAAMQRIDQALLALADEEANVMDSAIPIALESREKNQWSLRRT